MANSNSKNNNVWWKHWFLIEVYKAAAVLIGILIVVTLFLRFITRHNQELEVPDFSGMSVVAAEELAENHNLRIEVSDSVFLPKMERGAIFRQSPRPGSLVKKNRRILLTINSMDAKQVKMPSVIGYSLRQAKAELVARQLHVGRLIYVRDMATNNVLSQKINGRNIAPGKLVDCESEVDLEVGISSEMENTFIPNVIGLPIVTAKDMLIDNSLNIGKLYYDESIKNISDSVTCFVIKQIPSASEFSSWSLGTKVDLFLSTDKNKLEAAKTKE